MIVVDSSALIAVLREEPGAQKIEGLLGKVDDVRISAFTLFECRSVVLRRHGLEGLGELAVLLDCLPLTVVPFDAEQSALAFEDFRSFGKGSGHPAQLNLGDCSSYALE